MRFLTTGQVARRCGVGVNTIKRWIRMGQLDAVITPGGHWRIPYPSFSAFQRTQRLAVPRDTRGAASKVLVIDDDPPSCDLLCAALEAAPYELVVESASDGYQGLVMIGQSRPHLIVLDIMMPNINGLELIQRLRATPEVLRDLHIVVVTAATGRPLVMRKLEQCACDAVIPKPVDLDIFVTTVGRLVGCIGATKTLNKGFS